MRRIGICLTIIASLLTLSVINDVEYMELNANNLNLEERAIS